MENLGAYQQVVFDVFSSEADKVRRNPGFSHLVGADPSALPYLREAIDAVGPDCAYPDDAAAALGKLADELHAKAERDRGADDWAITAVAMGWARTAAVRVWDLPSAAPGL